MAVPSILTERLDLVSLSAEFFEAILAGRYVDAGRLANAEIPRTWPGEHEGFMRLRLEQLRADPASREWLVRAMVLRDGPRRAIGHLGFHGPPGVNGPGRRDAVEVGYFVEPAERRRGYALEAVRGLLAWAANERGIGCVIASIRPDNAPSLALVEKLGFVETGRQWDDDEGEELVFELRTGRDQGSGSVPAAGRHQSDA